MNRFKNIDDAITNWLGGQRFYSFYQARDITEAYDKQTGTYAKYIHLGLAHVNLKIKYRFVPDIFEFMIYDDKLDEKGQTIPLCDETDAYGPDLPNKVFNAIRRYEEERKRS